uniref:Uncharacterized protein n=1 Tax=Anguilla anguilla TaxID=7936 RepID=A0A0E9W3T8_ANGAN
MQNCYLPLKREVCETAVNSGRTDLAECMMKQKVFLSGAGL